MTMNEVIKQIGSYDEIFETINGHWVVQSFDTPYTYTEFEFTADKRELVNILYYDDFAEIPVLSIDIERFKTGEKKWW